MTSRSQAKMWSCSLGKAERASVFLWWMSLMGSCEVHARKGCRWMLSQGPVVCSGDGVRGDQMSQFAQDSPLFTYRVSILSDHYFLFKNVLSVPSKPWLSSGRCTPESREEGLSHQWSIPAWAGLLKDLIRGLHQVLRLAAPAAGCPLQGQRNQRTPHRFQGIFSLADTVLEKRRQNLRN